MTTIVIVPKKKTTKKKIICGGCKCSTCRDRNGALVTALDILEDILSDEHLSDESRKRAADLLLSRGRE